MASTYLSRTMNQSENTNSDKKFTYSGWIKKSETASDGMLIEGYYSSTFHSQLYYQSNGALTLNCASGTSGAAFQIVTNRLLRDCNAWYHIVVAIDTTQGTASDRAKIYINGVQETSFSGATYPDQNASHQFNRNGNTAYLGRRTGGGVGLYFDGLMSHIHTTIGYTYNASAFGSTDSTTGEWKINTSPSVTYGTNGFFILKDGNSVTDQSGNSNNFTVGGGTLTKTEDCPSNVFATINPLDYSPNPATLQNGNTTYNKSSTGDTHNASMTGTLGAMTGKWYFEFKPTNTTNFVLGMIRTNHGLPNSEGYYANDAGCYGISNGGKTVGGSGTSISYSYSANDILGMAFDLDNGKFYAHVNGTYITSGDPTSGSTGTGSLGDISLGSNIYVPFVTNANYNATNLIYFNFGNGYFGTTAVSSAGTNASGNGIFEYDTPTGFTALSTKGLNL